MITHTFTLEAMAMPFTVKLKATPAMGLSIQRVATYRQLIQQELDRLDHEFSPFRSDSLVRRFARQELTAPQLTRDFQTVYGWAVRAQDQTAGAFNPFFAGHYDPTGLVKGWAIQRVFEQYLRPALTRGDLVAAAINGAGDVQTGVAPGSDFYWRVGIENPLDPIRPTYAYRLQNAAVATSGTRQHGDHIVRQAPASLQQATVVCPTLTPADIYATAAVAMGRSRFLTFSRQHQLSGLLVTTGPHAQVVRIEGGVSHDA